MGRGKGKVGDAVKSPWDDIEPELRNDIENMKDDEIRQRVAEIHLTLQALNNAKELDQDLKDKKAAAAEAGRTYREQAKGAKLLTKYALSILEARGKA